MRLLSYLGWVLLACAFVAGVAEAVVHAVPGGPKGLFIPAYEVWSIFWPRAVAAVRDAARAWAPGLWDPVLVSLMKLPGWVLFAVPGGLLAWFCRRERAAEGPTEEDEESALFLYDALDKAAREAGYDADAVPPSHDLDGGDADRQAGAEDDFARPPAGKKGT